MQNISSTDYDVNLPQQFVEQFAASRLIEYLDTLPLLRSHVREVQEDVFDDKDCHLNNRGHNLVGRYLHDWLVENFIKPAKTSGD